MVPTGGRGGVGSGGEAGADQRARRAKGALQWALRLAGRDEAKAAGEHPSERNLSYVSRGAEWPTPAFTVAACRLVVATHKTQAAPEGAALDALPVKELRHGGAFSGATHQEHLSRRL